MAGVQGMGSPSQVQPAMQEPVVSAPPAPSTEIDYEALASSVMEEKASSEVDYEALAGQVLGESAPEEKGFYQSMKETLSPSAQAMLRPAELAVGAVRGVINAPGAIGEEVVKEIKTGEGDLGRGVIKAFQDPAAVDLAGTLEKEFPKLAERPKVPVPSITPESYGEDRAGNYGAPIEYDIKKIDGLNDAELISLAADAAGGEIVFKGITKAAAVSKILGKSFGSTKNFLTANKVSKLDEAVDAAGSVSKNVSAIEETAKKFDIPLTQIMKDPTNPDAVEIAGVVKSNKVYQEVEQEIGDRVVSVIKDQLPKSWANLSDDAATTDEIYSVLKGARKKSGKQIEALKEKAIQAYGNSRNIQAPEFQKAVDDAMDMLTTSVEENKLYISDPKKEAELTNYLQGLSEKLFNKQGKMTFGEWEQEYKALTKKSRGTFDRDITPIFNKLRQSLSRDQDSMMAIGLEGVDDAAAKAFKEGKATYSQVMKSYEQLGSMLEKNDFVSDSMIKKLFFSEAKSADDAKAVFDVLAIENPKMTQDLRGKAYNYLINNARNAKKTPDFPHEIDFKKFAKEIRDLQGADPKSTNLLDVMTGSKEASKSMREFADVMEAVQNGYMGKADGAINETLLGRATYSLGKMNIKDAKSIFKPIADGWKRDKKLKAAFENIDMKNVLKGFPPKERAEAEKFLRELLK
jgi:hypothetical protein